MPPKPLPVYSYPPAIGLPLRPLPYPPTNTDPDQENPNARCPPMPRSTTDPDSNAENSNARHPDTDTHIFPANQADMNHPDPNQEEEHFPANQADMDDPDELDQEEHPAINNKMPETPSKFAAIGLEQMVLASPRYQPALPRTMGADEESFLQRVMRGPVEESFMQHAMRRQQEHLNRLAGNDTNEFERRHPPPPTINAVDNRIAGNETNQRERTNPPPPRRIVEGYVGLTPTRNTRAVTSPVQTPTSRMMPPPQTPVSRMPPPQTPASRMKVPQSPASRLLKRTASPAYIVRSTGAHDDGVNATPRVVRVLFPSATPNASEHQPARPQAVHDPQRQSRVRPVSFASAMDEDTEMASPSVATAERSTRDTNVMTTPQSRTGETQKVITPEYQTGGSPPMPQTPRTPRTWISPSQITPAIEARMRATPVYQYRNPDEPREMTPSPPKLEPASPDDRKMEDAFWTPNKQGASSNVAGLRQKVAAAENLTPAEYKSAIVNSVPFGVAMAQDFARSQHVSPIRNPAPAQDGLSPGTTTMKTFISTEITTTIKTTPSPLQSPTPAPKPTDNRRRNAAKPQKTADAPRREVASTPQRKEKGGAEQNKNRRRSAKPIIPGGINRRQELRTESRYSLRDSTRDIMPGTYSMTPVRNRSLKAESPSESK